MPALLIKICTAPCASRARAKASATDLSSPTSTFTAVTRVCCDSASAFASRCARLRPIKVSVAPSLASANAIAAPMPRPPPVTTACLPASACMPLDIDRDLRRPLQIALELRLAGEILLRPFHCRESKLGGGVQGPERIGQMRPGERAQVGATRRDDAVYMIGFEDVADRHGGNADLVADAIRERRLIHASIDRIRETRGLP